ncbi:glycosyltransferase [Acinetobacter johnsonii]|uniref:glycosyltransferase n=1 Tax=Acinetobacter johnsonii TaxID=40214 RepID=UPI0030FA17B4
MNILHIAPEWKWSKIFIFPIIYEQIAENNCVWISTPNSESKDVGFTNNLHIVKWSKKYKNFLGYILSVFTMIYMVRKLNIKKVYSHTSIDSFIYILFLRVFTNSEIIYVNHGVPYSGYKGIICFILKIIEFVNVNFAKKVVTITFSMVSFLEDLNVLNKKIETMVPGTISGIEFKYKSFNDLINVRHPFEYDRPLHILYVGRIEERKGIYDLIRAVEKTTLQCDLTILGGTENQFNEDFESSRIKFVDFQSDLTNYYLNADVLCVPSHHEGFGQVYLEAASYGVIPICCNIPGPTDFIMHNKNGFVVQPKNTLSIINLFDEIAAGVYNLRILSEQAYISSKKYERSKVLEQNLELFR